MARELGGGGRIPHGGVTASLWEGLGLWAWPLFLCVVVHVLPRVLGCVVSVSGREGRGSWREGSGMWELFLSVLVAVLPACASEDAAGVCAWDASVQGNGQGSSFVVVGDRVFMVEG